MLWILGMIVAILVFCLEICVSKNIRKIRNKQSPKASKNVWFVTQKNYTLNTLK